MPSEPLIPDEVLLRRLQDSRRFWETDGANGSPLVMPGANLSGLDLRETVLASAQLQGADLRDAKLDSAILVRAALDGAQLDRASLFGADASKASMVEARLPELVAPRSTWVRSTLTRADLTGAVLDDSNFSGAELIGAQLNGASLRGSVFSGAVLLGASFAETDVTRAVFEGAAIDPKTLTGFSTPPDGQPIVAAQKEPPSDRRLASEFERHVAEVLRQHGLTIFSGFRPRPDFVVRLGELGFVAIEAVGNPRRDKLMRVEPHADIIVVPDRADVRPAINGTPVVEVRMVGQAIQAINPAGLKPDGALAVVLRQASRLQPYQALAAQVRVDPTSISRISVYVDERQDFLLNSRDRAAVRGLPAHLDGGAVSRSGAWAEQHFDEITDLIRTAASLRRGEPASVPELSLWAARGLSMESELADFQAAD
jgi:uncharacterized protein YjbI with pentapeptide repeats